MRSDAAVVSSDCHRPSSRLLRYFMLNPDRVLSHAQLLANVWNQEFVGSNKVVATYVVYLRRKLACTGCELIHTQRAVGYCLRLPRPEDNDPAALDDAIAANLCREQDYLINLSWDGLLPGAASCRSG